MVWFGTCESFTAFAVPGLNQKALGRFGLAQRLQWLHGCCNFPPNRKARAGSTDTGSYGLNSNNQGTVSFLDTPTGKTFTFGIVLEAGNAEFRGARINPGDPLIIVGEKQATVTAAQFLAQGAVTFDAGGGGTAGQPLGVGFDAVGVEITEHLDPETNTTPEGGGTIFFNVDNGYDSTVAPGFQALPPGGGALVCDFHLIVLQQSTSDGTQLSHATTNPDFGCPLGLGGAAFDNASVVWGATNSNQFAMTVGTNGVAAKSGAAGNVARAIAPGSGKGLPITLVGSNANLHPIGSAILSNASPEPLDYTSLSLNGTPDLSIASPENSQCTGAGAPAACCTGAGTGTCTAANCTGAATPFVGCTAAGAGTFGTCASIGDIHANNALFGPGSCTIAIQDTGGQCTSNGNASCTAAGHPFTCCSGSGTGSCVTDTGTYEVNGNDHAMAVGTQTTSGVTFALKCL